MKLYAAALLAVLAACVAAQTLALRASGGKTLKSESNYFSSLARLQTEPADKPAVMLLGSSMTGRLGDRARRVEGVANLGCDGGSAVVTLRAIDRGHLPAAPLLIIEANSRAYELEGRGREIGAAIDSEWFRLGTRVPNLGATARPTAFAYSWLMARKLGPATDAPGEPLTIATRPELIDAAAPPADPKHEALVAEVSAILRRLREKGSDLLIVMLPPGVSPGSAGDLIPRAIAARSGVRWWDLTENLPPGEVTFSDGIHLDAPSAQKVMDALMREVRKP